MKKHQYEFLATHGDADHLHEVVDSGSTHHKNKATWNSSFNQEHVDKVINDPDVNVRKALAKSQAPMTPENLEKLLGDVKEIRVAAIANRKDLNPRHIEAALTHPDPRTRRTTIWSQPLNDEQFDKHFEDSSEVMISNHRLKPEHVDRLLDKHPGYWYDFSENPNLTQGQFDKVYHLAKEDPSAGPSEMLQLYVHPKFHEGHIDNLIKRRPNDAIDIFGFDDDYPTENPNIQKKHVDRFLNVKSKQAIVMKSRAYKKFYPNGHE